MSKSILNIYRKKNNIVGIILSTKCRNNAII